MARQYARISRMVTRSADKTESVRITADEQAAARAALKAHRWTVPGFLAACLVAVAHKPAEVLELVGQFKPRRKPRGRPRKTASES